MSVTPPLQTSRLDLEPVRAMHAEETWPLLDDDRMWRFFPEKRPATIGALRELYVKWERGSPHDDQVWWNWLCRERGSGRLAGAMQATIFPDRRIAYIAYAIFPQHQRLGFAREASLAIIQHVRQIYDVDRMYAEMATENEASYRLAESLGFTRVRVGGDEFLYELRL